MALPAATIDFILRDTTPDWTDEHRKWLAVLEEQVAKGLGIRELNALLALRQRELLATDPAAMTRLLQDLWLGKNE